MSDRSGPTVARKDVGRLAYLSLEALSPGRAAHTHVTEIIEGLEMAGWAVSRFLARPAEQTARPPVIGRFLEHARVLCRLLPKLRGHDVLYVRGHPLAWPAAIAAKLAGLVVVHEINGAIADLGVTYPWMRPVIWLPACLQIAQYRLAHALFPVTPGLVDWARRVAPNVPVHLVPNGANLQLFSPAGARHVHPRPYALFVGSLARWHGVDTMLAAALDPLWPPDTDLIVTGDGAESPRMCEAAAKGGPIVWLRRQDYATIPVLLRGAVAALVPISNPGGRSGHGVLPLKLFEAMACGTPVVVTDLPGQEELVRETNSGLVIAMDDAPALAAAVARLRNDPSLARELGLAGATAAHRAFGWRHRANQLHEHLMELRGVVVS